jgi:flagellar export protein FliJ
VKKFTFPLARVMDWRNTQARVEENKLERMYTDLRGIDARAAALDQEGALAQAAVIKSASVTGAELAALDSFRRFTVVEHRRLSKARADCSARVAAQIQVVASKRRDVRLLERLKEQRLKTWEHEYAKETDAEADEAFLAKWKPVA